MTGAQPQQPPQQPPQPGLAMLRVATASIEDSARMVASGDHSDPIATLAISTAAGSTLLEAAGSKTRAQQTVTRYLARMGGRATPYGLFAGTAVIPVGAERRLELAALEAHAVRSRVDVAALESVVAAALDAVDVTRWPLRVTPLARSEGAVIRFARPGDATADVVAVRTTAFISQVLELLGDGTRTGAELMADLREWRPELTSDTVRPLLVQLVEVGLLERFGGVIEPGVEPAERVARLLAQVGATEQEAALRELLVDTGTVRPLRPDLRDRWQGSWARASERIPALAEVPEAQRYDVQLELAAGDSVLDRQTVDALTAALLRVQQVNSAAADSIDDTDPTSMGAGFNLSRFRTAFRARYEDAEVPLLAAVDLESGVLQPAHRQVSRLAVDAGVTTESTPGTVTVTPGVLAAYRRFAWAGGPVDIADFTPAERLASRSILATLLDRHEDRYTAQLVGGVGRSPFALLARFGLGRPAVAEALSAQIAAERAAHPEDEDVIRAELVYHPGGRIGNVLVRPRLLDDTLALSGAGGGTISLDRISIRLVRDEFLLRDLTTGRPVVVELNTAHNIDFAGLDPVYAVLGRLAGGGGAGWNWGALGNLDHLPRVTCGPVIVAPEQWQLSAADVLEVSSAADPGRRLRHVLKLDDERHWLGVGTFDHILPIDLTCDRSVQAALARTSPGEQLRLVELPQVESPAVRSPRGRHVAEVVLPVGPALRPVTRPPGGDTFFCPESGAKWLYVRYHCGQSSADHVIARAARLADQLSAERVVDDWFFVRYAAEGYHVRVRMRAASTGARERVLTELTRLGARLRADSLVGRVVVDDYVPEVARYGGMRTLAVAERVFSASSARVARLLAEAPTEEARLFTAVSDIVDWVSAAQEAPEDQITLLQACQSGLSVSFARHGNRQGKFFRSHRAALHDHLERAVPDLVLHDAVRALVSAVESSPTPVRLLPVFGSCLHMHCNRLFAFDAVRLEYLSYDLAIRTIRERAARQPRSRQPAEVSDQTGRGAQTGRGEQPGRGEQAGEATRTGRSRERGPTAARVPRVQEVS